MILVGWYVTGEVTRAINSYMWDTLDISLPRTCLEVGSPLAANTGLVAEWREASSFSSKDSNGSRKGSRVSLEWALRKHP